MRIVSATAAPGSSVSGSGVWIERPTSATFPLASYQR
jgi:hypothetical protein